MTRARNALMVGAATAAATTPVFTAVPDDGFGAQRIERANGSVGRQRSAAHRRDLPDSKQRIIRG